ncbi:hypothetical protein PMAYCL1PPCAC_01078, partial [Pristionchus mayeri]
SAMCNLFLTLRPPTARHSLILLSIRDEMLQRPTAAAAWRNGVLSGIDLQDPLKGTWFGINEQGKIGVLLSITASKSAELTSRGRIVHDFLSSSKDGADFCSSLVPHAGEYNGFTFVAIDRPAGGDYQMHSFTNALVDELAPLSWPTGTHVVGNCPPHATFEKMKHGKALFQGVLDGLGQSTSDAEIAESLFSVGADAKQCYPDSQLESQVKTTDPRCLSSIFIRVGSPPLYGTRCQTALIVNADGSAFLRERRLLNIFEEHGKEEWESNDFSFIVPPTTQ